MIVALVGASGVGKTTMARELLSMISRAQMVGSVTTRLPRPSDLPGEYEYVSVQHFIQLVRDGAFVWNVSIHGAHYGTMRTSLDRALLGHDVEIMMLIPHAMEQLWRYAEGQCHKVRPFFLTVNSEEELRRRLVGRGDAETDVVQRIDECRSWAEKVRASHIPYCVVSTCGNSSDIARLVGSMI